MAAGQTVVEYNDVRIHQCLTTRFEQEEELDPSGVDTMFHRFRVSVVGYVHGKTAPGFYDIGVTPNTFSGSATDTLVEIEKRLSTPRRNFRMRTGVGPSSGGIDLLNAQPITSNANLAGEIYDVCNGPRCKVLSLTRIVGDELFRVECSFEICVPVCEEGVPSQARVLSNKWTCSDSIDQNRYTTRMFSGQLRTVGGSINANSFRHMVVPSVAPGMRIQSMHFDVSADGLWLKYTITHKEVAYAPPHPATSWDVVHTEKASMYEPIGIGDIVVSLTGDRDVDRKELIAVGLKIMNDRLRDGDSLRLNSHFLQSLSISDYFGSEGPLRVVIQATVKHVKKQIPEEEWEDENDQFLQFSSSRIGTPIDDAVRQWQTDYDSNYTIAAGENLPTAGPISLVGAFVAHLQNVCRDNHWLYCTGQTELLDPQQMTNCDMSLNVVSREGIPELEEIPEIISEGHANAIYTSYQMESTYSTPSNKVAMPVARDYYSEGKTQEVIALCPPTTSRVMRMQGVRVGLFPAFPAPVQQYEEEDGTVATLLHTVVRPATTRLTPDGHELQQVDAEYHYALSQPLKPTVAARIGVNPWQEAHLQRMNAVVTSGYSEDSIQQANA